MVQGDCQLNWTSRKRATELNGLPAVPTFFLKEFQGMSSPIALAPLLWTLQLHSNLWQVSKAHKTQRLLIARWALFPAACYSAGLCLQLAAGRSRVPVAMQATRLPCTGVGSSYIARKDGRVLPPWATNACLDAPSLRRCLASDQACPQQRAPWRRRAAATAPLPPPASLPAAAAASCRALCAWP